MLIPLGAFLTAAAAPIVIRVLGVLGLGILTFTGVSTVINTLLTLAQGYYGGIGGFTANIIGLAGFGEAFAIIGGSLIGAAVLSATKRFGVVK